jgi:hypothetical protein
MIDVMMILVLKLTIVDGKVCLKKPKEEEDS